LPIKAPPAAASRRFLRRCASHGGLGTSSAKFFYRCDPKLSIFFTPRGSWGCSWPYVPSLPSRRRDALAYAQKHQPSLRAAQARVEVARRAASVVRSEWLPQVGATVQAFYGTMNNSTASFLGVRTMDLRASAAAAPTPAS
jgi:hypothetical protein